MVPDHSVWDKKGYFKPRVLKTEQKGVSVCSFETETFSHSKESAILSTPLHGRASSLHGWSSDFS